MLMDKVQIIYSSRYGSAKRYAEKLGSLAGADVRSADTITSLPEADTIVYIAGIYAGGMRGLKRLFGSYKGNSHIIFVSVGIADPSLMETRKTILTVAERQLPLALFSASDFFHLRGCIDYSKLSLGHSILMKLMKAQLKGKKELDATDKAFLETYGQKVDFTDFSTLSPIVRAMGADEVNIWSR